MTQDHWHIVMMKQFRKHTPWQPAATLIHPSITRIQVGGTHTFSFNEQLLPRSPEERESPKLRKEPPLQELVRAGTHWRKATLKEKPEWDNLCPYHSSHLQSSYPYSILAPMHSQPHEAGITDIVPFTEERRTLRLSDVTRFFGSHT